MSKQAVLAQIQEIAENAAAAAGVELVEIELKGGGKNQFLRVSIDTAAPRAVEAVVGDVGIASEGAVPASEGETPEGSAPDSPKLEGVTHSDCETVSRRIEEALDAADLIRAHYTLEVSSPGVERKLLKLKDFERFQGKKAKVVLREPLENQKYLEGKLAGVAGDQIALELAGGERIHIPHGQVERANLKFEW